MCRHQHDRCLIPPSPELRDRIRERLSRIRAENELIGSKIRFGEGDKPGFNDGLTIPGNYFPLGTSLEMVRHAAVERAPLRGSVRVVVVLVDFTDHRMDPAHDRRHFTDLFFSNRTLPGGSVRDYFHEVSNGAVDIVGEVVGPYTLPKTLAQYANGDSGTGNAQPNARTMARHAAEAVNVNVDFKPYDNDGNGFVDAFIVIHAGEGAEVTGRAGDIWSHKWVLSGGEFNADGTKVYAYLTVPEDARIGVCCHELGHLLFGWPDLYDIDGSSEGLGNWCLMAGGSWNGGGDVPAHPSAWCKAQQGWVTVVNQTTNGSLSVAAVTDKHTIHRLWKEGGRGNEYFLVENRQQRLYDRLIPGSGLLIYHIDDSIATNGDERHPKVRLLQADGSNDLTNGTDRGDDGDCYPGRSKNRTWNATSTPHSKSYGDVSTNVSLTEISNSGPVMTAKVTVKVEAPAGRRALPWPFPFDFPFHFSLPGLLGLGAGNIAEGKPLSRDGEAETAKAGSIGDAERLFYALGLGLAAGGSGRGAGTGEEGWREEIERRLFAIEGAITTAAHFESRGVDTRADVAPSDYET